MSITGILPNSTWQEAIDKSGDVRVHGWLHSRDVISCLEVLDISYKYRGQVLPPSAFRLAPKLRVASFHRCHLPGNLAVDFVSLQRLSLYNVTLTQEAPCAVLSRCPALRSLRLEKNEGSQYLRISSPALRSFGFYHSPCTNFQELVIEDAPFLERLLLHNDNGRLSSPETMVRVVHAPRLKILGCLSRDISQLHLGKIYFQELIAVSLTTTMPTVKVLALDSVGPDLDTVLDFLKCFSCLERLYVALDPWIHQPDSSSYMPKYLKNVRKYALPDDPIECLEFHLQKVALKFYCGMRIEVEFARFFVLNAKVIEKIEFGLVDDQKDEWMVNQSRLLELEDRASPAARFEFKRLTSNTLRNNKKLTHDLSMTDPLGLSF